MKRSRSDEEDGNTQTPLKLSDYKDAYVHDPVTYLHCLLGRANQQFPELFFGHYQEVMVTEKQYIFARVLRKRAILIAVNCDDSPLQLEVPIESRANQAINILDATVNWDQGPGKALDLSGCTKLPVKDHVLQLDLPANSGKMIQIT